MIDMIISLVQGALTMVALIVVILVAANILVGALSTPVTHDITDDWERRNLRGER